MQHMYLRTVPLSVYLLLNSCAGFQGVADDVEKMVDNDAITIKIDKDSFHDDTNVHVNIDVINDMSEDTKE